MGYPEPFRVNNFDLQSLLGPVLYIYIFQLLFPVFLTTLVMEKEKGLQQIMQMMGLSGAVYSVVTYLFYLLLYVIATGALLHNIIISSHVER